jgi:hypothetical protein
MKKARQLGDNAYLLKPSNPLKLVDLVRDLQNRWLPQAGVASG